MGEHGSALNAAVMEGFWDLVEILLDAGATPDCKRAARIDEVWLRGVVEGAAEEKRRGYEARYRKFWEVESARKRSERVGAETKSGELWWFGVCFTLMCVVLGYWR